MGSVGPGMLLTVVLAIVGPVNGVILAALTVGPRNVAGTAPTRSINRDRVAESEVSRIGRFLRQPRRGGRGGRRSRCPAVANYRAVDCRPRLVRRWTGWTPGTRRRDPRQTAHRILAANGEESPDMPDRFFPRSVARLA